MGTRAASYGLAKQGQADRDSTALNEALSCKTLGAFHSAIAGLQAKPAITVNAMQIILCRVTTRMHKYRSITHIYVIYTCMPAADLVHMKQVRSLTVRL